MIQAGNQVVEHQSYQEWQAGFYDDGHERFERPELSGYLLYLYDLAQDTPHPELGASAIRAFHESLEPSNRTHTRLWEVLRLERGTFVGDTEKTTDFVIDELLGIDVVQVEEEVYARKPELMAQYPNDTLWLGGGYYWTNYSFIRDAFQAVPLSGLDKVYDLGSGHGRIPLYAGIVSSAACRGVEAVTERIQVAQSIADRLPDANVSFIQGDVREADISDGNVFYMYSPFSPETYPPVFKKLEAVAEDHPITVIYKGGWRFESLAPWLYQQPHSFRYQWSSLNILKSY